MARYHDTIAFAAATASSALEEIAGAVLDAADGGMDREALADEVEAQIKVVVGELRRIAKLLQIEEEVDLDPAPTDETEVEVDDEAYEYETETVYAEDVAVGDRLYGRGGEAWRVDEIDEIDDGFQFKVHRMDPDYLSVASGTVLYRLTATDLNVQHPRKADGTYMVHCCKCGSYVDDWPGEPPVDFLCETCEEER